jgi:hypothetical protein
MDHLTLLIRLVGAGIMMIVAGVQAALLLRKGCTIWVRLCSASLSPFAL